MRRKKFMAAAYSVTLPKGLEEIGSYVFFESDSKIGCQIRKEMQMKVLNYTFGRFVLVGIVNTIVGTGTMFLAYNLFGLSYWISSALNYIVGSIVSYLLNKHFTFRSKEKSVKSIVKFIVNISVCYLIAYGVAKPLVYQFTKSMTVGFKDNIAMLVGMVLFVILNYCGQRFFVFKM